MHMLLGKLHKLNLYFMLLKLMKKLSNSRIIALFMVVFLGLLSNNCGNIGKNKASNSSSNNLVNRDLEEIKADGKLKVAIANSSSSYFIYRGQPMGYEFELLQILADSLKLKLEIIVVTDLDSIFDMLNGGDCDLAAAHLTITEKRSKLVSFTNYHATTRQVLVQRRPSNFHKMSASAIEKELIREPYELIGKEVKKKKNSSYYD
ncbi:MAG: transporter substrate-binding domain-containing protein, partial [Bacteroidetes bacterium]|nr:transporter substrate-binding domain-containing protein [Bacteroidota bacterium]